MALERPAVIARHRGVRPVFLLALALALSIAVLVVSRARRDEPRGDDAPGDGWVAVNRTHCNPVEVTSFLARTPAREIGVAERAACLAFAGKLDAARGVLRGLNGRDQALAVAYVFDAAHPVADAGDDESAGPIMELVVDFQPDHFRALYHAGMARARPTGGDDARARDYLTRFLAIYRADNHWTQSARRALAALDRPPAARTVERGGEGSIVY